MDSSAVERHTYSVNVAGKRTDALETALAEGIEDQVGQILDKLDASPSGTLDLSDDERVRLSRYLGSLYTRVPAMAAPFVKVMNEMVLRPGWEGLDIAYVEQLVSICQLSKKAAEKEAWDVVLGYLRPGAPRRTLTDDSRLHRVAVGAVVVAAFVYSASWMLFRMPPTNRLVLPDRPVAMMGRLEAVSAGSDDLFFAVPLSPNSPLVGMKNSPLADQVVPGGISYPFLREAGVGLSSSTGLNCGSLRVPRSPCDQFRERGDIRRLNGRPQPHSRGRGQKARSSRSPLLNQFIRAVPTISSGQLGTGLDWTTIDPVGATSCATATARGEASGPTDCSW